MLCAMSVLIRNQKKVFFNYKTFFRSRNIQTECIAPPINSVINKDESRELKAIWPDIVRDLTKTNCLADVPDFNNWLEKVGNKYEKKTKKLTNYENNPNCLRITKVILLFF